ncbi:hypothetical protein ERX37_09350 [Macrococcus hajekii]|uniref:SGNH/GDSL hydrolase family protein n=1 Tax=Macrococcus hajekii TaxID=198482 RepID=A0A4R6BIC8_9STAP|nr:hypothetical protein [Macrococcus hajekii]TDM01310.1 hypothetical protein ERX37_09350 [Macrococcus hajekii]GGB10581.1 hypothetical protein GCM10007190_18260 [Macrococcus hajekii]
MKNIMFWLYVVIAILLIGLGYYYWQSKVTTSDEVNQTKNVTFNDKALQKKNKDQDMDIVMISTPYQVTDNNNSVYEELKDRYDSLKFTEVMVSGASDQVDIKKITSAKPDLVIMDALTLNDFTENVSAEDHNKQILDIIDKLEAKDITVRVLGTRPSSDKDFNKYQQAEEKELVDSNVYTAQSDKWQSDDAMNDYYHKDSQLLTRKGLNRWIQTITDSLFK